MVQDKAVVTTADQYKS